MSDAGESFIVTPTDITQLTGTISWRFLFWGVFSGDVTSRSRMNMCELWESLGFSTRMAFKLAKASDPGNPTPFMIFLSLIILSLIARRVLRA